MDRRVAGAVIGVVLVSMPGLTARGDEWTSVTHIDRVEISDAHALMRLHLHARPPNPALCTAAGPWIDLPHESRDDALVDSIYIALVNDHDVELQVDDQGCSERDAGVLTGIRLRRSRHQVEWPAGDEN